MRIERRDPHVHHEVVEPRRRRRGGGNRAEDRDGEAERPQARHAGQPTTKASCGATHELNHADAGTRIQLHALEPAQMVGHDVPRLANP
jgi:hypothetical protein